MTTGLLTGPLAQAIGLTLLHTLWQAAIVVAIAAAALALLRDRSAAVRYAIACGALALIVVFAVGTAWQLYEPPAAQTFAPPAAAAATAAMPDDGVVIGISPAPTWHDRAATLLATARAHVPQIVILWLAGVLLLSIRLGVSWWRVQAMARRNAIEADDVWQRAAARLARALGLERPVRLVVSSAVDVPSVVGWLKPVVLIAVSSVSGLTTEQLEMVLAHELAHVRRHDFLVNAIQSVVETLLFYNPFVWWISRQIRIERENCCDDLAVSVCGDAVAYARALAQLESMRAVPAAAAAVNGSSLADRVRRLVGSQSERSLFSSGWTAAAAVTSFVLLLGLATAPLFAERTPDPTPKPAGAKIEVTAPQAVPATPAKPATAPKAQTNDDDDDVDVDMPEPPEPPEPPVIPMEAVHAMRVMVPRIKAEAMANAQKALADMQLGIADGIRGGIEGGIPGGIIFDDEDDKSTTPPGKLSVNELIALKIQGVTPEYIQQVRSALPEATIHDVIAMKLQGVAPEYVRDMRAAGAPIKKAHDAVALKMQQVTPDFVRSLVAAGYDHLSVHDIIRLKMFGVNGDFIRQMEKYKK